MKTIREVHLRRLMEAGYPVIARVPAYLRKELAKGNVIVPEYIEGKILAVERFVSGRKQCAVTIREGMGWDIKVFAVNVIRFKGRGDEARERYGQRPMRRKRRRVPKQEQTRLFG